MFFLLQIGWTAIFQIGLTAIFQNLLPEKSVEILFLDRIIYIDLQGFNIVSMIVYSCYQKTVDYVQCTSPPN